MSVEPRFIRAGRPSVRIERRYPHPIEKVWRAVTEPAHLAAWFPSPVEIDLRLGGTLRFSAFAGSDAATGIVEELDPPRLLGFSWGADRLRFELAPDGAGTAFVLVHSFDDRAGAASFATGWEMCLAALGSELAGRPLPAPDRGVARHEELVAEFGLDLPELTVATGGWTARWDRQLTCSDRVAWDLWFGRDPVTGAQRRAPAVGEPVTPHRAPGVVLGTVTEVDEPHLLAFAAAPDEPGESVRLELVEGTGHGARLVLTVAGADPAERDAAVDQWGNGLARLAREAADGPVRG